MLNSPGNSCDTDNTSTSDQRISVIIIAVIIIYFIISYYIYYIYFCSCTTLHKEYEGGDLSCPNISIV